VELGVVGREVRALGKRAGGFCVWAVCVCVGGGGGKGGYLSTDKSRPPPGMIIATEDFAGANLPDISKRGLVIQVPVSPARDGKEAH